MRSSMVQTLVWHSLVILVVAFGSDASEISVVSPAGLDDVEGNGEFILPAFDVMRQQQVYPAADFAALPASHRYIESFALRTDVLNATPYTATSAAVEVRMSTTSADSLSTTFDNNVGSDEMVVFSGMLDVSDPATILPGGAHTFEYTVTLQDRFEYDPGQGNLLVELSYTGFVVAPSMDAYTDAHFFDDGQNRLIAAFGNSTTAEFVSDGVDVAQFVFVPETFGVAMVLAVILMLPARSTRRTEFRGRPS